MKNHTTAELKSRIETLAKREAALQKRRAELKESRITGALEDKDYIKNIEETALIEAQLNVMPESLLELNTMLAAAEKEDQIKIAEMSSKQVMELAKTKAAEMYKLLASISDILIKLESVNKSFYEGYKTITGNSHNSAISGILGAWLLMPRVSTETFGFGYIQDEIDKINYHLSVSPSKVFKYVIEDMLPGEEYEAERDRLLAALITKK